MTLKQVNTCDFCTKDRVADFVCIVCGKDVCGTHSQNFKGKLSAKFGRLGQAVTNYSGSYIKISKKELKLRACKKCSAELKKRITAIEDKTKKKIEKVLNDAMDSMHSGVLSKSKNKPKKKVVKKEEMEYRVLE